MSGPERVVWRYAPAQRFVHWMGVASVLILLDTGLALLARSFGFIVAGGFTRTLHRIAAVPFVLLPALYFVAAPREARELIHECLTYGREDLEWLKHMPRYLLGSAAGLPPQGRLNAGQKIHHAGTFVAFLTITLSGVLLWFAKGHLGATGLAVTAIAHDLSMAALLLLAAGHVYFTFLYDALSAMTRGYVSEAYARAEHRRWLDTLPPDAFVRDEE